MTNSRQQLNAIAEAVIDRLKDRVIIHRYDSYSTNSIYLKFDYGAAYSLRISDHSGKSHLAYRFNIQTDIDPEKGKVEKYRHGKRMVFYAPNMVKSCCRDILLEREARKHDVYNYDELVAYFKNTHASSGFWSGARKIN